MANSCARRNASLALVVNLLNGGIVFGTRPDMKIIVQKVLIGNYIYLTSKVALLVQIQPKSERQSLPLECQIVANRE